MTLGEVATLDELMGLALQAPRYLSLLVSGFAAVALVLSLTGIYGILSYFVQRQRRDIGIRLALAAVFVTTWSAAWVACVVPPRRAAATDPMKTLRSE